MARQIVEEKKAKPKYVKKEDESLPQSKAKPQSEISENPVIDVYTGVAEKSHTDSPYAPETLHKPYNPDDLWQKRASYEIYEDMLNDDQVDVCLQLKKGLVMGSGWDIVVSDDSQTEIKECIEKKLGQETEKPFEQDIEEILSAYEFGVSLTEPVFRVGDDGMLGLKFLKTRHPNTFLIHTDKQGNVTHFEQRGYGSNLKLETKSIIHYINRPKFQNPYGRSDLRPAYNAWFVKRQFIKFYAIFGEKAMSAIPVAKYDINAPPEAVTEIYNAIKKFQTKTALAIPKQIDLEWLETNKDGEGYVKAINLFNMFIGRSLFVPDLVGMQGGETGGGSYSLGTEQIKLFFNHINQRRKAITTIINNRIIKPMVVYNYGFQEKYPEFRFRPLDDKEAIEKAKVWLEAVKGKTYKPSDEEINHFRKAVNFPEGDVEFHEPLPFPSPLGQEPIEGKEDKQNPKQIKDEKEKFAKKIYDQPPGEYYKKVNFKALNSHLDSYKDVISAQAEPVINKIYRDLFDQLQRKKIIQSTRPDRIENIKLKYIRELKQILKQNLYDSFKDSKVMAQQELLKGNFRSPLPNEKFMEVLEQETFDYIGDWEYQVTKAARTALMEAIKDGKPLSSVIDFLDTDGKDQSMTSLERYSQTKLTEVMNRGRLEFFEDSGVVAAYQYSAILDDRSSDICAGLHGKVFKSGSEPVPPLHFNCRSTLVPITKFEDWKADAKVGSKDIDAFIDDNKGKGFPKR